MLKIKEEEVKKILEAVTEAYNILDDLHGDLTDQHEQIRRAQGILEEIPSDVSEISEEVDEE